MPPPARHEPGERSQRGAKGCPRKGGGVRPGCCGLLTGKREGVELHRGPGDEEETRSKADAGEVHRLVKAEVEMG